jgi:hypothetical protein
MRLVRLLMLSCFVLPLASCSGDMTTEQKIKAVQDAAISVCSYLPEPTSVAEIILATNASSISKLAEIGQAICTAVKEWQAAIAAPASPLETALMPCPRVNGICIDGSFVNPPPQ